MKSFYKLVCHFLILSLLMLPFTSQAAMVSTGDVVTSATEQANRDKIVQFASRADVQKKFETLGLTAENAKDRVNAMTQDEVNKIAGQIDTLPAGADSSGWWWAAGVIIIGLIIWSVYK